MQVICDCDCDLEPIGSLDLGLTIIDSNDPFWFACDDHNSPVITFSGANVLMPALTLFLIHTSSAEAVTIEIEEDVPIDREPFV